MINATQHNLIFKGGRAAYEQIKREGFSVSRVGTLAGASGGAKWLVLSQIDRVIAADVLPKLEAPVHLLGSSIGAWRFACFGQAEPLAAIERFEDAYIHQSYSVAPDREEITTRSREILGRVLRDDAVAEILSHPTLRLHVMAVRSRHTAASENSYLLGATLIAAASLNAVSRRSLGLFFERALFHDPRDLPPFHAIRGMPLQTIELNHDNLEDAVVATGSIPLLLAGVRDIAGARPGVYRDGGIIDYHLDLPQSDPDRLTLYPHFYGHIVPGWFDKRLGWRKPDPDHLAHTVLISPSDAFVAKLPGGKIPDRKDFHRYAPAERIRIWNRVVAECAALADELCEVLTKERLAARLVPLTE